MRAAHAGVGHACARVGSDVVQVRLMLRPCIGLVGADAARLFYDRERFTRVGAAPEPVKATLFGKGALQTLDGKEHLARKAFFLRATPPERVASLVAAVESRRLVRLGERGGFQRHHAHRPAVLD